MQTCGRRGHGARLVRENRLVTLAIRRLVVALDVRRKRNVAQAFEHLVERGRAAETQSSQTEFRAIQDLGLEFSVAEQNFLARGQFPPGAHQRFPLIVG